MHRSLLTRLPQSVFVSVTVQGQHVFVVGQQPSFGRPAYKMHTRAERELERGRKRPFDCIVRPQWKLFHDPVRPFPHDAGIFGRDSRARYLSPAIWLIPGDPPRLSTSRNRFPIFFRLVHLLLPHLRKPGRTKSLKLFLKY